MDSRLQEVVSRVQEKFNPVSIFLYGSRSRGDFLPDSDYEVGVLYRKKDRVHRSDLTKLNPHADIVLYPFEYESFLQHKLDTPFPDRIYLRDLKESAKTLSGEDVVGRMDVPPIRTIDVLQTLTFHTGIALAAVLSYRQGDHVTAGKEFSKSLLFAARCLILAETGSFPWSYQAIYDAALTLDTANYKDLLTHAMEVREGAKPMETMLFKNITFQNQLIQPKILKLIEEKGINYELRA